MELAFEGWMTYQFAVLAVLLALLGNVVLNFAWFRRPPRAALPAERAPMISVCVPARNEALRIGNLLRSLAAQDYPNFEVLILNDRSEDGTGRVIESYAGLFRSLRVIPGRELPEGWVGKCWACHQLSLEATGEWLLFTDADTEHAPDCLTRAAAFGEATGADLLSLWPRQRAETWSEKLVIPLVYFLLLVFLPHGLSNRMRNGSMGAANGQFVMFRRRAYDAVGGHHAVRDHLVEDIALSRLVIRKRMRMINGDGAELVGCRMYHRFSDLWEGFTKNLRPAFDDQGAAFVFFGLVQLVFFVLPYVWLLSGFLTSWLSWGMEAGWGFFAGPIGLVLLAQIAVITAVRMVFALRFGQSVPWAFLHFPGQVLALCIALNSWCRTSFSGGVSWKGRVYRKA